MRANQLLKHNVAALLKARGQTRKDLAQWCWGRSESWISKIFKEDRREFPNKYLDRIADFFGLATYQLFQPGLSRETERRHANDRRNGKERRVSAAKRVMLETAAELDRVRPVSGKTHHVEAPPEADPVQRILNHAAQQIRRINSAVENPRRQTAVARQPKTTPRARPRTASRSDDSASPAKPVK